MNEDTLGDGPIEEKFREHMNRLARDIDVAFNPSGLPGVPAIPRRNGFVLLAFEFNATGRCNYISNAVSSDVVALLKAWIFRAGRSSSQGRCEMRVVVDGATPNTIQRIDSLWAAISTDDTGEGVCAITFGGICYPPIAADPHWQADQFGSIHHQNGFAGHQGRTHP